MKRNQSSYSQHNSWHQIHTYITQKNMLYEFKQIQSNSDLLRYNLRFNFIEYC